MNYNTYLFIFQLKFEEIRPNEDDTEKPKIHSHFTCATDTQNIQMVFNLVEATIFKKIMSETGLL